MKLKPKDNRTISRYLFGGIRRETPQQRAMVLSVCKTFGGKLQPLADGIIACPEDTVAGLMHRLNLNYHDIVVAFRQVNLDEGILRMYSHLPKVMEDTAIDALSKQRKCKHCRGTGKVIEREAKVKCLDCDGRGKYIEMGDHNSRKLLFDAAGLSTKFGLQVNTQLNVLDGGEALETSISSARHALAPPKIISAEVTNGE